ncbi:twin-arginine translocation signal domain-containing protein [Marinobacter sp. NSM]|uniref:twin-arginine translocation signal domain-containing protein n=1 Tax=Marinobacter sp. NSM TaxID=3458004 RepID=UPI004036FF2E
MNNKGNRMARLTRRDFLKASALGMGAVAVSTGLAGCVFDSSVEFTHGVASATSTDSAPPTAHRLLVLP